MQSLSQSAQNAMNEILLDCEVMTEDGAFIPLTQDTGDDWLDDDDDDDGDDVQDISHEGGEYMDAIQAFMEDVLPTRQSIRSVRNSTAMNTRERIRDEEERWAPQVSALAEAFMRWRHRKSLPLEVVDSSETRVFHVRAISTFYVERRRGIPQQAEEYSNVSLVKEGFLGCSPTDPSVAISLDTLELFHRLKRRHPRLGIQPFVKALCDLHEVTYLASYRNQFSKAFDMYLTILREVERLVKIATQRDTPDYRMHHSCPACNYRLQDEPEMIISRLAAMDGNNSVKRLLSAGKADDRIFKSDYFLSREEVDVFKDEVKHSRSSADEPDAPWVGSDEHPEDQYEADGKPAPCADSWKASAAEYQGRAKAIYDSTGMFASACRHGFVLKVCEMVQSGELRKYSLAILHNLMTTFGKDIGVGFDIGCSMQATVRDSPKLGPLAKSNNLLLLVNAFHGWAHNRMCQVFNHPLYIKGVGIEDLETMERLFSSSNSVAAGIRLATKYHWAQNLDIFFRQHDDDKYVELGRFLYNNLRQANSIVKECTKHIEEAKKTLGISEEIYEPMLKSEQDFFVDLKETPAKADLEVAYIDALVARDNAEAAWRSAGVQFVAEPSRLEGQQRTAAQSNVRGLVAKQQASARRFDAKMQDVELYQKKLGLSEEWSPDSEDYKRVEEYSKTMKLRRAMNKVQFLVVQRLLEFEKCNAPGMSYKLRNNIAKHMKSRGVGLKSALGDYNSIAASMTPPAPLLDKNTVFEYAFIAEFDLLRHTYAKADITEQPWTDPVKRQLATKYFKRKRAEEELVRVNVEMRRLATWIRDENISLMDHVAKVKIHNPVLALEIDHFRRERYRMNRTGILWLQAAQSLPEFTGNLLPGKKAQAKAMEVEIERDTESSAQDIRMDTGENEQDVRMDGENEQGGHSSHDTNDGADIALHNPEEERLMMDEILSGRTEDDLVADDDRSEVVAQTVDIMQAIENDDLSNVKVQARSKKRNRLQDRVPNYMMNRFRI